MAVYFLAYDQTPREGKDPRPGVPRASKGEVTSLAWGWVSCTLLQGILPSGLGGNPMWNPLPGFSGPG